MSEYRDPGYGREFAAIYDRLFAADARAERCCAWLASAHPGDGAPSLELGVGTGRIALPLARRTGEVVGVDSSPEMLDRLRDALARHPVPVRPVLADIRDYADERHYALVLCVLGTLSIVLEEVGQQDVLFTCARALSRDGTVVIETHNPAAIRALHGGRPEVVYETTHAAGSARMVTRSIVAGCGRVWRLEHIWHDEAGARPAGESSRLTEPDEIDAYAARAGLRLAARFADWDETPFSGSEPMVISVFRPGE